MTLLELYLCFSQYKKEKKREKKFENKNWDAMKTCNICLSRIVGQNCFKFCAVKLNFSENLVDKQHSVSYFESMSQETF